jgi:hypothetical protein
VQGMPCRITYESHLRRENECSALSIDPEFGFEVAEEMTKVDV